MYLEDADICHRLGEHGWATVYQSAWSVIHDAQRKSHRNLAHLRWYLSSALLFLLANPGLLTLMPCLGKPEACSAR
jgi:N-acetylglucosaminyl-diphospho-decaprenol L-rhamnosyltransferase